MADQTTAGTAGGGIATLAGKYLTFELTPEVYGLEILKVREIIGLMSITAVPRTPDFVRGVINLRGKVIPVIDLRRKFDLEPAEDSEETCVIVVDVGSIEMGIVVDRVSEVLNIPAEDIEGPPAFGENVATDFILGMGKTGEHVTILLDISRVLTGDELEDVATIRPEDNE